MQSNRRKKRSVRKRLRDAKKRAAGKDVLEVASVSKAYGTNEVLRDVSLTIRRGEKVAIIGPNGLGKSTLLKIVMGVIDADQGTVRFGHEVRAGYFAQDHHEILRNESVTPLEYIWEACPNEGTSYVRGQLGRVLFSGDDVTKSIGALSESVGSQRFGTAFRTCCGIMCPMSSKCGRWGDRQGFVIAGCERISSRHRRSGLGNALRLLV